MGKCTFIPFSGLITRQSFWVKSSSKFEDPRIWLLSRCGRKSRQLSRNLKRYFVSSLHKYVRAWSTLCSIVVMIASIDLTVKINSLETENSWGTGQIFSMINLSGFISVLIYKHVSLRGTKGYEDRLIAIFGILFLVPGVLSGFTLCHLSLAVCWTSSQGKDRSSLIMLSVSCGISSL